MKHRNPFADASIADPLKGAAKALRKLAGRGKEKGPKRMRKLANRLARIGRNFEEFISFKE